MITYNHHLFIKEAIEGVLSQQVDFGVELIILDDASPFNINSIILDYIKNHPNGSWIRYERNVENLGMSENFIKGLKKCEGMYIAICEGDDYWTDPLKLQRQVAFLDSNQDYVMIADNSIWYEVSRNTERKFSDGPTRDVSVFEILRERQFSTASVLFRNSDYLYKNLDKILGDVILWVFLSKLGVIRFDNYLSSVYRRHPSGMVLGSDKLEWAKTMEKWNSLIIDIAPNIPYSILRERNFSGYKGASDFYLRSGNFFLYIKCLGNLFRIDKPNSLKLLLHHIKKILDHLVYRNIK
ncbi:glycosyltransferase [Algoriphagus formosus]|uniref:glycosyltransferase n=1 Tax=Algoriphagus formosus TaxID=2007308 RepID=UPI0012FE5EA6|nr:glycosyltransferase [Algoriphagus formosus]